MKIRKKIFDKNFDILFVKKREKKVCFSIIKLYTVDQRKGAVFLDNQKAGNEKSIPTSASKRSKYLRLGSYISNIHTSLVFLAYYVLRINELY